MIHSMVKLNMKDGLLVKLVVVMEKTQHLKFKSKMKMVIY